MIDQLQESNREDNIIYDRCPSRQYCIFNVV